MRRTGRGFALAGMVLVVGVCGCLKLPQKSGKQGRPLLQPNPRECKTALYAFACVLTWVCGGLKLPQKLGKQVGPVAAIFQVGQNRAACFRLRYTVGLPFAFALAERFARCARRQRDTLASYDQDGKHIASVGCARDSGFCGARDRASRCCCGGLGIVRPCATRCRVCRLR